MTGPHDMSQRPDKLSVIVFSGAFERVHYALATAAAAAAIDTPATLFFTMEATRALAKGGADVPGWHALPTEAGKSAAELDANYRERGVAGFEELLDSCVQFGVTFMVCEMGLRAMGLEEEPLRDDVPLQKGGVVTFLNDASKDGVVIFI